MLKPRQAIRRFDVFAEYNRLKTEAEGRPADEAKAYGIWLAKVVAARKFARTAEKRQQLTDRLREPVEREKAGYMLGDEEQTAATFDRDIVQRMGADFYSKVFAPAIAAAVREGKRYESIRDAIRAEWKP